MKARPMDLRRLTDSFTVSPQIDAAHLHEIAGAGFRSILCNRPDGEEAGQPAFDEIAAAARAEGLEARLVPISGGMITAAAMAEFRDALAGMPKPILAYCRTGTRCTMLWAAAEHGIMDETEIERRAAAAGYDVSHLLRQLSAR